MSGGGGTANAIFSPTPEHAALRNVMRKFTEEEVEPQARTLACDRCRVVDGMPMHCTARLRERTARVQANEFNRAEKFNAPLFKKLGALGVLGITVDARFGGAGMDATAAVIVHEEMAASDPAFTLSYLAHSMLFMNNLHTNGSDEQRSRYLPRACTGELIGGMCMSEPGHGTDVLGMRTNATRVEGGDGYVVNGAKMWITNGAVSDSETGDAFLVYARTAAGGGGGKHSLMIVEKGMHGFSLGQRIKDKLGMRASPTAELVFDNVRVPGANLVGKEGDAMLHMMRNLEIERLTLAAMSLGIARRSIEVCACAREAACCDAW